MYFVVGVSCRSVYVKNVVCSHQKMMQKNELIEIKIEAGRQTIACIAAVKLSGLLFIALQLTFDLKRISVCLAPCNSPGNGSLLHHRLQREKISLRPADK